MSFFLSPCLVVVLLQLTGGGRLLGPFSPSAVLLCLVEAVRALRLVCRGRMRANFKLSKARSVDSIHNTKVLKPCPLTSPLFARFYVRFPLFTVPFHDRRRERPATREGSRDGRPLAPSFGSDLPPSSCQGAKICWRETPSRWSWWNRCAPRAVTCLRSWASVIWYKEVKFKFTRDDSIKAE